MDQFFQWISATPVAGMILVLLVAIFVLAMLTTYLVAFYQGREISLWPPKLGARPIQLDEGGKHISKTIPVKEPDNIENTPHRNRMSVVSIRLSSKPIAALEGVDGPVNGSIYIIVTGHRDVTVGVDPSCDLPINSNLLSRHHFRLRISLTERSELSERGFLFELIDSGSSNGTFLNGEFIGKPKVIENGDLIEAGDCGFRFFILSATKEKRI